MGRIGSGVRVSASFQKNPCRLLFYGSKKGLGEVSEGIDVLLINPLIATVNQFNQQINIKTAEQRTIV